MLRRQIRKNQPDRNAGREPSRRDGLRDRLGPGRSTPAITETYRDLRARVQQQLIDQLDAHMDLSDIRAVRSTIEELYHAILEKEKVVLNRTDRAELFDRIVSEIIGFGPLDGLLRDDEITEIMVNGSEQIYIERHGHLEPTALRFDNDEHVLNIIHRMVAPLGRRIDESSPMVDARLPDGSRINAIIPPLSLVGPVLTIRKFSQDPFTIEDLINFGTMTREVAEFLEACVKGRLNIVVSGGSGAGKTTLLNVLSSFIPPDERIITIENAAELQLHQEHVVTLESRLPNIEGRGEVTIRDLVINALRMRPDRIIVGEVRGGEALDMLQAMNTGHDGSLTTAHSNGPRDTLRRIETMALMAGMDLPLRAIREQVASALDLIIHVARMRDGNRKIVNISEVQGMEGDVIVMQDIFTFQPADHHPSGDASDGRRPPAQLKPTGVQPGFMTRLENADLYVRPQVFGMDVLQFGWRR